MPRFNYSLQSLDKRLYRSKSVPACLSDIAEKVRENGHLPTPALVLSWQLPDAEFTAQTYEGGPDCIPGDSDLGRLVQAFGKLGVTELDNSEFKPVKGKYYMLDIYPVKTNQGLSFKRYPSRFLSSKEIQEHFKVNPPLFSLEPLIALIQEKLLGVSASPITLPAFCLTVKELRPHIQEVNKCIVNGLFFDWLKEHTQLEIEQATNIFVMKGSP